MRGCHARAAEENQDWGDKAGQKPLRDVARLDEKIRVSERQDEKERGNEKGQSTALPEYVGPESLGRDSTNRRDDHDFPTSDGVHG